MTTIATAHALSAAPVQGFFDRWADVDTWSQWNTDTEWVHLDGPFQQGVTGRLKPKGAPSLRFTVAELIPGRVFTDVSSLIGARLTFRHVIAEVDTNTNRIDVTVSMTGPLSLIWRAVMAKGLRSALQQDLDGLVAVVENRAASSA
jgi:hypothetical protein